MSTLHELILNHDALLQSAAYRALIKDAAHKKEGLSCIIHGPLQHVIDEYVMRTAQDLSRPVFAFDAAYKPDMLLGDKKNALKTVLQDALHNNGLVYVRHLPEKSGPFLDYLPMLREAMFERGHNMVLSTTSSVLPEIGLEVPEQHNVYIQ